MCTEEIINYNVLIFVRLVCLKSECTNKLKLFVLIIFEIFCLYICTNFFYGCMHEPYLQDD